MPTTREPAQGYTYQGITIPLPLARALDAWIDKGEVPGDFLQAVLRNDLREAIGRASATSRLALHAIVVYLYNEAPGPCWGSPERVEAWAVRFVRTHGQLGEKALDPTTDNHEADTENSLEQPEAGLLSNLPHDA